MSDVQVVRASVAAATQATNISKTHKEKKNLLMFTVFDMREVRPQKRRGHTQKGSLHLLMCKSVHLYIRV